MPFSKLDPEYVEELWARIGEHARMEGDCTVYDRHHSSNGYGRISVKGVLVPVHRFVYEYAYGEQPRDVEIDHLCHNRTCIRLAHLEAVDRAENARRRRSHGFHETGGTRSKRWIRTPGTDGTDGPNGPDETNGPISSGEPRSSDENLLSNPTKKEN